VLTLRLFLPSAKYNTAQALRFYRVAVDRITALPGIKSATAGSSLPLLNTMEVRFDLEGSPPRGEGERPSAPYAAVGSEYFRTLGIPLRSGRFFTEADNERAPLVGIVSEALAGRYFSNQDPVGRHIVVDRPIRGQSGEETVRLQVVGVVGNVKLTDLAANSKPVIYVPHSQNPWSRAVWFAARTQVNPASLGSAVRGEFMAIDKDQPIEQVGSLEQILAAQFAQPKFQTQLMSSFALMALILAVLGIYGVNAYAVTQRRHEIGLRMALGASRGAVLREVIARGMRPTAVGIGVGTAGAVASAVLLRNILVGTGSLDPVTFLGATLLLAGVAVVACYLPARTATRIDPAIVLKAE
jgi:predicted permease